MKKMKTTPIIFCLILLGCLLSATGCVSESTVKNQLSTTTDVVTSIPTVMPTTLVTPIPTECPVPGNGSYWIKINPISDHYIGDMFEINGTTNIGINDTLSYWTSRVPRQSRNPSQEPVYRGIVRTQSLDCHTNVWSFLINTTEFRLGYYDVAVGTENMTIGNWDLFVLSEKIPKSEGSME